MPTVIVTDDAIPAAAKAYGLYYALPLVGGEDPTTVDLSKVNPDTLIPVDDKQSAHVVRWMYGGDFRVARIGQKRGNVSGAELSFLASKGLAGLLRPVGDTAEADDVEGVQILVDRNRAFEAQVAAARVEVDQARAETNATKVRLEGAERRAVEIGVKLEQAQRDLAEAKAALDDANAKLKKKAPATAA